MYTADLNGKNLKTFLEKDVCELPNTLPNKVWLSTELLLFYVSNSIVSPIRLPLEFTKTLYTGMTGQLGRFTQQGQTLLIPRKELLPYRINYRVLWI